MRVELVVQPVMHVLAGEGTDAIVDKVRSLALLKDQSIATLPAGTIVVRGTVDDRKAVDILKENLEKKHGCDVSVRWLDEETATRNPDFPPCTAYGHPWTCKHPPEYWEARRKEKKSAGGNPSVRRYIEERRHEGASPGAKSHPAEVVRGVEGPPGASWKELEKTFGKNPLGGRHRADIPDWDPEEPCVNCGRTDYDDDAGECEECEQQVCANCWVDGVCFVCHDPTAEESDENPKGLYSGPTREQPWSALFDRLMAGKRIRSLRRGQTLRLVPSSPTVTASSMSPTSPSSPTSSMERSPTTSEKNANGRRDVDYKLVEVFDEDGNLIGRDILPAVRIRIRYGNETVDAVAIVDSGSGRCLLPRTIADDLGIDVERLPGPITQVSGAGSMTATKNVPIHLSIFIGDETVVDADVDALVLMETPRHDRLVLLGQRPFFEWYKVSFDFPKRTWSMQEHDVGKNPAALPPLTAADVVAIHAEVQNAGGPHHDPGVRDEALLVAMVDWFYPSLMSESDPDPFFVAASLCHHVVDRHPFWDCNHRTGWTLCEKTLAGFGYSVEDIEDIPKPEVIEFVRGIDRDGKTAEEVAEWLRAHANASSWARNFGRATSSFNPAVHENGAGSRLSSRGTVRGASVRPAMSNPTHGLYINPAESNPKETTFVAFRAFILSKRPGTSDVAIRSMWDKQVAAGVFIDADRTPSAPAPAPEPSPPPVPIVTDAPPVPPRAAPPPRPQKERKPREKGEPEPGKVYQLTGAPGAKTIEAGATWKEAEVPAPTAAVPVTTPTPAVQPTEVVPATTTAKDASPLQIFAPTLTGDSAEALAMVRSGSFDRRKVLDLFKGLGASVASGYGLEHQALRRQVNQQAFFTPVRVTEAFARIAGIPEKATVLDPTCGPGRAFWGVPNQALVHGIDKDADSVEVARAIYPQGTFVVDDVMNYALSSVFDYVYINPPFNLSWTDELAYYDLAGAKRLINSTWAVVELAIKSVKTGGIVGMVLPVNTFYEKEGHLGKWLRARATMLACIVLPKDENEWYFKVQSYPVALFLFWKKPSRQLMRRPPENIESKGSYTWAYPTAEDLTWAALEDAPDCGWFAIAKTWDEFDEAVRVFVTGKHRYHTATGEVVASTSLFSDIVKPYADSRNSTRPVVLTPVERPELVRARKYGADLPMTTDHVVSVHPPQDWAARIDAWDPDSPVLEPNGKMAGAFLQMMRAGYVERRFNRLTRRYENEFDVEANRVDRLYYGDVAFDEMAPVAFLRRFAVDVRRTPEFDDFFARKLAWAKLQAAPFEQQAMPVPGSDVWVEFNKDSGVRTQFKDLYDQMRKRYDELAKIPANAWMNRAFEFQKDDACRLALKSSALLADDMGVGKTLTSDLVRMLKQPKATLIVCPAKLRVNWMAHFRKMNRFAFQALRNQQAGLSPEQADAELQALVKAAGMDWYDNSNHPPAYDFETGLIYELPVKVITASMVDPWTRDTTELRRIASEAKVCIVAMEGSGIRADMDAPVREKLLDDNYKKVVDSLKEWRKGKHEGMKYSKAHFFLIEQLYFPDWASKWPRKFLAAWFQKTVQKEFGYKPSFKGGIDKMSDVDKDWVVGIAVAEKIITKEESETLGVEALFQKISERGGGEKEDDEDEGEEASENPLVVDEGMPEDYDYNIRNPSFMDWWDATAESNPRGKKAEPGEAKGPDDEEAISTTYFGHVVDDIFDMVIVDEAHTMANAKSALTRGISALRPKSVLLLTGTPLKNRVSGLYPLMAFAWKPGSAAFPYQPSEFVAKFLRVVYQDTESGVILTGEENAQEFLGKETVKSLKDEDERKKTKMVVLPEINNVQELRMMLDSMMLRRSKNEPGVAECVQIPDPKIEIVRFKTSEAHFEFYQKWAEAAFAYIAEYLGVKREVYGYGEDEIDVSAESSDEEEGAKKKEDAVGIGAVCMSLITKLRIISSCPGSPSVSKMTDKMLAEMFPKGWASKRKEAEEAESEFMQALAAQGFTFPTYDGSLTPKQQWVLDRLKEWNAAGKKTLVLTMFMDTIDLFAKQLSDANIKFEKITGEDGSDFEGRFVKLRTFASEKGPTACNVILGSLKTLDTGLDIPQAENVIMVDPDWNYADMHQAWSRVLRSQASLEGKSTGITQYTTYILLNNGFVDEYTWLLASTKGDWSLELLDRSQKLDKSRWRDVWGLITEMTQVYYQRGIVIDITGKGEIGGDGESDEEERAMEREVSEREREMRGD